MKHKLFSEIKVFTVRNNEPEKRLNRLANFSMLHEMLKESMDGCL